MATEDRWLRVVEGGPANQPLGTLQGYEFHNFVVPPHNLFPCPTPPVDGVGGGAARGFTADNAEVREQSCPLRSGGRGYAASTRPAEDPELLELLVRVDRPACRWQRPHVAPSAPMARARRWACRPNLHPHHVRH